MIILSVHLIRNWDVDFYYLEGGHIHIFLLCTINFDLRVFEYVFPTYRANDATG